MGKGEAPAAKPTVPRQSVRELAVETPQVTIESDQAGGGGEVMRAPRESTELLATAQEIRGQVRSMLGGFSSVLSALQGIRLAIEESRLQVAR